MKTMLTASFAAFVLLGTTACAVDAQEPEPESTSENAAALVASDVADEGGQCQSYCDDRYCYICRANDGICACIIAD